MAFYVNSFTIAQAIAIEELELDFNSVKFGMVNESKEL